MRSRKEIDDMLDRRHEAEREILWDYYKRIKHMTNKDARSAVASHFKHHYGYRGIEQMVEQWFKARQ